MLLVLILRCCGSTFSEMMIRNDFDLQASAFANLYSVQLLTRMAVVILAWERAHDACNWIN